MAARFNERIFANIVAEITKTLCPTALSPHLCRIDTKYKHPHHALYESDRIYFRVNHGGSFIREAREGEFDYTPSNGVSAESYPALALQSISLPNPILKSLWKHIPRLWVLCTDFGNGTHQITTIYRGDAAWPVAFRDGSEVAQFKSADELRQALEKIQACEGVDEKAWKRFCQKCWDTCIKHLAAVETKAAIN